MTITQGLHRSLQHDPGAVATACGDRVRTIAQQHDRVARLAGGLLVAGMHAGDRIAIVSHNSDRMVETLLAAAWAGLVFVPLNTRWSPAEITYAIDDVGAAALAVDDVSAPLAAGLLDTCPTLTRTLFLGDGVAPDGALAADDLATDGEPVDDVLATSDTVAGVFYTGGTTARPKGVVLTHGNLVTAALGALATGEFMVPGGTALHAAPLFHLAGIWPWVSGMLIGSRHVIVPVFEPKTVIAAIRDNGVTDVLLVPVMIQHVVTALAQTGDALPSLRHLTYAGSPISETLLDATEAVLPDVGLVQAYGMTELSPVATMLSARDHVGPLRRSAGRAVPHSLVRIVDPDDRTLPTGEIGEVVVAGAHVMRGYWNQPDATRDALRGGWMHTGDAGYMDADGTLYLVDRIKDMIISGGENIYSGEVENALASHPSVAQCAVIGLPDPTWGERVHAVLVLFAGATTPTTEQLREHVSARIARYKAPRTTEVVDALPVSAAGKILKRDLRAARQENPE